MGESLQKEELMELGNRLIHLRYSMDAEHMGIIFSDISMADYMILVMLSRKLGIHQPEAKVYLSEISAELNQPIPRVSKMVQNLQNKGYVYWQHDEDGSRGTYIFLSETGRELIENQQEILKDYFEKIVNQIGKEKMVQVLDLMSELDAVMVKAAEEMEEPVADVM